MPRGRRRTHPADRFWRHVDKSGRCWLWTGWCRSKTTGYGEFALRPWEPPLFKKANVLAHRYAWFLKTGRWPKLPQMVLHQCPHPRCVRHLYLGIASENTRDSIMAGTFRRGERHGNSKLTGRSVRAIRRVYAAGLANQYELAEEFCVSQGVISQIVPRQAWKHVH